MLPVVRRLCILLQAGLMWTVSKADASFCTKDQVSKCRAAAVDGKLDTLAEGGICKPNKYVEYTHECAVTSYLPTADYCCCAYEQRVFCCRYHYDWNYFRCDEDEDIIHYLTNEPLAIEILVPAIVVPSVALLCFIFYCIKCCCCNDDDEDEDRTCDMSSCCRRKKRRRREKAPPIRIDDPYSGVPDTQSSILLPQPLKDTSLMATNVTAPEKCDSMFDFKQPLGSYRTEPSAPPYDITGLNPPPYNPDLYEPTALDSRIGYDPMPYITCQADRGQGAIYQSVMTRSQIPLPVTKLAERPASTARDDSDNDNLSGDNR